MEKGGVQRARVETRSRRLGAGDEVDVVWAEMRNRRRAVEARRGRSGEAGTHCVETPLNIDTH